MSKMRPQLLATRKALEINVDLPKGATGLKVWLLPPWYARDRNDPSSQRVAWADVLAAHLNKPRVVCAGELRATDVPATGRSWAIGKGLIGAATHDDSMSEKAHFVIHNEQLKQLGDMDRKLYKRLPKQETGRRSQKDIKALCSTYGTALAVGLRDGPVGKPFGCLTMDVATGTELGRDLRDECAEVLVANVPEIVQAIADWGNYVIG